MTYVFVVFFQATRGLCHCRPQLGTLSDDATFPQSDEVEPRKTARQAGREVNTYGHVDVSVLYSVFSDNHCHLLHHILLIVVGIDCMKHH